ncbi:MAG TPA: glycosyltransferase [Puia sp.]|nr:glycosyltransferase [Puia sp.]
MGKRVVIAAISDLATDQRLHKVSLTLQEAGYDVLLIGTRRRDSLPLAPRSYPIRRIRLLFQKGAYFFAEFNFRLFLRLLFTKGDIFLGNDLDAIGAVWLAGTLRRLPVVYDTHEYYLGMPELNGRAGVKKVWQHIEAFVFPRLRYIYTICDSFRELYYKDYGKTLGVVRNVPYRKAADIDIPLPKDLEEKLPKDKFFLLFQGAGINPERGVEELVLAMPLLDPARFHLVIIGGGENWEKIVEMVRDNGLSDRITLIPKIPFEQLRSVTRRAHLGLSLDKPNNINHIYGLPNKIFDYLHSGVPVLVSRVVELEKIVNTYDVGDFIENHQPAHIAAKILAISSDPGLLERWKRNTATVREELCWERESRVVVNIFEQVASKISY